MRIELNDILDIDVEPVEFKALQKVIRKIKDSKIKPKKKNIFDVIFKKKRVL